MTLQQKMVDDSPVAGAEMTIKWRLSHNLMVFLEIDTEAVEPAVPPNFSIVEVRPGIALMSLSVLHYRTGNFWPDSPEFDEVVGVISVHPDLSIDMPTPRYSFYPISVYSESPDFCRTEVEKIHTPTYLIPSLDVRWAEDGMGVSVRDDRGPILSLRNVHPAPVFKHDVVYGQHYNATKGGAVVNGRWAGGTLLKGPWEWDGYLFEHQRDGEWGSVHQHPFFGDVDVSRVRGFYRMLVAKPGSEANERFYEMTPMVDEARVVAMR